LTSISSTSSKKSYLSIHTIEPLDASSTFDYALDMEELEQQHLFLEHQRLVDEAWIQYPLPKPKRTKLSKLTCLFTKQRPEPVSQRTWDRFIFRKQTTVAQKVLRKLLCLPEEDDFLL